MGTITEDNFLVWNQGKNPLVNFNFMLRVELLYDLPCKSVKAFTREMEYEFIQEGGVNDYVHMRRKPITRPFTLEVERYVGVDYLDPMPLGADLALPVLLFVGRAPNQFIPFVVARTYVFTGCTVMKKVYGELVGDRSGLLVETTTLGYREMLCVDIPWSAVTTDVGAEYATPATNSLQDEARLQQLKAQSSDAAARAETASQDAQRYAAEAADVAAQLEAQLAAAMAEGCRNLCGSDYALSVTGVAGPDRDDRGNAVGTVFIALSSPNGTVCRQVDLTRGRSRGHIRHLAASHAFDMLRRKLLDLPL